MPVALQVIVLASALPKSRSFARFRACITGTRGQQKLHVEVIITNQKIQQTLTIQSQMSNTPNG
jgi:hypothetical protein